MPIEEVASRGSKKKGAVGNPQRRPGLPGEDASGLTSPANDGVLNLDVRVRGRKQFLPVRLQIGPLSVVATALDHPEGFLELGKCRLGSLERLRLLSCPGRLEERIPQPEVQLLTSQVR